MRGIRFPVRRVTAARYDDARPFSLDPGLQRHRRGKMHVKRHRTHHPLRVIGQSHEIAQTRSPAQIDQEKPDDILVLPWNLLHEASQQRAQVLKWAGRFDSAVPELTVL